MLRRSSMPEIPLTALQTQLATTQDELKTARKEAQDQKQMVSILSDVDKRKNELLTKQLDENRELKAELDTARAQIQAQRKQDEEHYRTRKLVLESVEYAYRLADDLHLGAKNNYDAFCKLQYNFNQAKEGKPPRYDQSNGVYLQEDILLFQKLMSLQTAVAKLTQELTTDDKDLEETKPTEITQYRAAKSNLETSKNNYTNQKTPLWKYGLVALAIISSIIIAATGVGAVLLGGIALLLSLKLILPMAFAAVTFIASGLYLRNARTKEAYLLRDIQTKESDYTTARKELVEFKKTVSETLRVEETLARKRHDQLRDGLAETNAGLQVKRAQVHIARMALDAAERRIKKPLSTTSPSDEQQQKLEQKPDKKPTPLIRSASSPFLFSMGKGSQGDEVQLKDKKREYKRK